MKHHRAMPTLLFVCQANVLRSAAAEAISAAAGGAWRFASAGVSAMVGSAVHRDVGFALAARGISAPAHSARQLTGPMLRSADLVLTFEVAQRAWAIREEPRSARSVLTIRRAAAVLGTGFPEGSGSEVDPGSDARAAHNGLELLRADRHRYGPEDDFADPIGSGPDAIAAAVGNIADLLAVILPSIGAGPQ